MAWGLALLVVLSSASKQVSLYTILDLKEDCSFEEIDDSYRKLRLDLLGVDPKEHDWTFKKHSGLHYKKLKKLDDAFATLSNQCRRSFYDKGRAEEAETECGEEASAGAGVLEVSSEPCSRANVLGFSWLGIAEPDIGPHTFIQRLVVKATPGFDLTVQNAVIDVSASYQGIAIWTASYPLCQAAPLGLGVHCPPLHRDEMVLEIPIDVANITAHTFHPVVLNVAAKFQAPDVVTVSCMTFNYKPPRNQIHSMSDTERAIGFAVIAIILASVWLLSKKKEEDRNKSEQHFRENAKDLELKRLKVRQQQGREQTDSGWGGMLCKGVVQYV
jgi:hypothetical protein